MPSYDVSHTVSSHIGGTYMCYIADVASLLALSRLTVSLPAIRACLYSEISSQNQRFRPTGPFRESQGLGQGGPRLTWW